jgi:hypothetical protein
MGQDTRHIWIGPLSAGYRLPGGTGQSVVRSRVFPMRSAVAMPFPSMGLVSQSSCELSTGELQVLCTDAIGFASHVYWIPNLLDGKVLSAFDVVRCSNLQC